VSKGDDALLDISTCTAGHFPQGQAGIYAGYYPANSADAIAHLERLRSGGADYLAFPKSSFCWLDHYNDSKENLERHYGAPYRDETTCMIFSLRGSPIPPKARNGQSSPFGEKVEIVRGEEDCEQSRPLVIESAAPAAVEPGDVFTNGGKRQRFNVLVV